MRRHHEIDLQTQAVSTTELNGEEIVRAGRWLIANTLLARGTANADPLSADNPLIISAGPFAGSNFSNANRVSIGCRSPLTGGIKEANGGGTLAFAMGQQEIATITLNNASDQWVIVHFGLDGEISFDSAEAFMGMGTFETAEKLHEKYGKKVSLAICGPVGEYQGLLAGISISDADLRPSRLAARGGVGAVMGMKKVKAVVIDLNRMPPFHDRKKVMGAVKEYRKALEAEPAVKAFQDLGTAMVADLTNHTGGLPVRNFSVGRAVDTDKETFRLGGDALRQESLARGGETTHACMPGCVIKCSNIWVDKDGQEMVSPMEYETIGLMGTNCGLTDPDELARINYIANDLGIDTIETGGLIGILMEAGKGDFGDVQFIVSVLEEIRQGTETGKLYAQGTARVGEHLGVERIPVIKGQTISAYDPRVIEVTAITMMVTAQGADHTAGNIPAYECFDKTEEHLVDASMDIQILSAAADSLGLCIFGRSVNNTRQDFVINAINDAHGVALDSNFYYNLGRETLQLEERFNREAGFTEADDELPAFFRHEALPPSGRKARFESASVNRNIRDWWESHPAD